MTKFETIQSARLDSGTLIRDLLGLEPSDLASAQTAGEGEGDALRGLGAFMRRVIETSVQVSSVRDLAVRLHTDAGAGANGWPTKKAADLAALLTWGLIQPRRRVKGLPFATLSAAEAETIDPPSDVDERLRALTTRELIAELERPIGGDRDHSSPAVASAFPRPVAEILRSRLGLDPATLHLYRTDDEFERSFDKNAWLGLERLARDVLAQYEVMHARNTTTVRLMSVDDARDARVHDVQAAHIATLLAASLHSGDGHDVFFLAPRTRSVRERAMLRQTAKAVYLDYSDEALQGLELICDGFVHFGHALERTIAERLLFEVASDCDPGLQRMPYCVSAQVAIELLSKAS